MKSVPAICDRTIRWGLGALILFTPLAFGTVEAWSLAIMEWGAVTLLLIFALGRLWEPGVTRPNGMWSIGLLVPVGLFVVFCVLQTIPMPPDWLRRISPGSARMYDSVNLSSWTDTARARATTDEPVDPLLHLETPSRRPVTLSPEATWERIRLVASLAALFILVVLWADREERVFAVLGILTIVGFLVALFGIVQFLTWNGKIYWIRKVPPSAPFGPFVNHNHFSGYIEMIIPVAASMACYLLGRAPVAERRRQVPAEWGQGALALFATVILIVALFFAMSRGGVLSFLVSGLVFFVLIWRRIPSRVPKVSVALALPLVITFLIWWIGGGVVARGLGSYATLDKEASFRLRTVVWQTTLRNVPDYIWVGSGLGTFEEGFAPHVPPGSSKRWDRAHNDYLQLLWETGLVGTLLCFAATCTFVTRYWWPAIRSHGRPLDLFRVGLAVALMSIALHSLVDFNLQIGSNGFLFTLLAGLLVGLHHIHDGKRRGPTALPVDLERHA